jgi:nitroimidazol reductase NimA-like FMN-containing flavoprotein (pyridoxamine 5'-phosphate oxidase superfamily)
MRRKDKEIKNEELIGAILRRASICRIALSENDLPYIVPLCFGHKDNFLYFHTAREGRKIDMIRKNNNVCFEIENDTELLAGENPCKWTMKYYSIIGFGKAFLVEDTEEKRKALDVIAEHYSGKSSYEFPETALHKVVVIKVKIETMTGKKSGY